MINGKKALGFVFMIMLVMSSVSATKFQITDDSANTLFEVDSAGEVLVNGIFTVIGSYINATVLNTYYNGTIQPSITEMFDIGSSSYRWRDLFVQNISAEYIGVGTDTPGGRVEIENDGTGNGLLIDQNGNGRGMQIDNDGNNMGILVQQNTALTTSQAGIAVLSTATNLNTDATYGLMTVQQNGGSSTQAAQVIRNEGTGNGMFIDQNGDGIALNIDTNSGNEPQGINVYTAQITDVGDYLLKLHSDSGISSGYGAHIIQDGSGDAIYTVNNGATGQGLYATSGTSVYTDASGLIYGRTINAADTGKVAFFQASGSGDTLELEANNGGKTLYIDQNGNGVAIDIENAGTNSALVVDGVEIIDNASKVQIEALDATGTLDSTTYLRGDGTWSVVSGGGGGTGNLTDYFTINDTGDIVDPYEYLKNNSVVYYSADFSNLNYTTSGSPIGDDGKLNGSIDFDGSNDYMNIDNLVSDLSSTTTGSWSVWVKPVDATPPTEESIITFGDTNGDARLELVIRTDGALDFGLRKSSSTRWVIRTSTGALSDNTWSHIVVTQDDVLPKIYVNGGSIGQSTIVSTGLTEWFNDEGNLDNGRIGDRQYNSNPEQLHFNGDIDEVAIYSRNLSTSEMSSIYDSGTGTSEIPQTGLAYHDTMDQLYDWSNNSNHGEYYNGAKVTTSGKINSAFDLDGTNDFVDTSLVLTAQDPVSFNAWIKHDGKTSEYNAIVANQNSVGSNGYSLHKSTGNKLEMYVGGFSPSTITGTTTLSSGTWYMVTFTFNGSNASIYIDGTYETSATGTATASSGGAVAIGRAGDFLGRYFDGAIDEVGIWSHALSQDEITELYNSGSGVNIFNSTVTGGGVYMELTANLDVFGDVYANDYITKSKVPKIDGKKAIDDIEELETWSDGDTINYENHYAYVELKSGEKGLSMETRVAQLEKMVYELNERIKVLEG